MAINSINSFNPNNFTRNVAFGNEEKKPSASVFDAMKVKAQENSVPADKEKKVKKVLKGVASFTVPGVAQGIDGRYNSGIKQFGAFTGLYLVNKVARGLILSKNTATAAVPKTAILLGTISALGALGVRIYSTIDAYKKG